MAQATTIAVLVGMLAASPAMAQSLCFKPSEPYLPWGGTAEELKVAQFEIESYVAQMRQYTDCLASEIQSAQAEARRVIADWNLIVADAEASRW